METYSAAILRWDRTSFRYTPWSTLGRASRSVSAVLYGRRLTSRQYSGYPDLVVMACGSRRLWLRAQGRVNGVSLLLSPVSSSSGLRGRVVFPGRPPATALAGAAA